MNDLGIADEQRAVRVVGGEQDSHRSSASSMISSPIAHCTRVSRNAWARYLLGTRPVPLPSPWIIYHLLGWAARLIELAQDVGG